MSAENLFDELFDDLDLEGEDGRDDGLSAERCTARGQTTVRIDGVKLAVLTEDEQW